MNSYVLIHGAWHGGWAWRPVSAILEAAGHTVFSPTMPGIADGDHPEGYSLEDCFKSVADLIMENDLSDVRLVSHSWGSCVGLGVVNLVPDRIAAWIPFSSAIPWGESLMEATTREHRDRFRAEAAVSANNTVALTYEAWVSEFMQDGTPDQQKLAFSLLNRQPMQYFEYAPPTIDPANVPFDIKYILADDDRTAPREKYIQWCERLGCEPIWIPGSHEVLFTRPQELADVLLTL